MKSKEIIHELTYKHYRHSIDRMPDTFIDVAWDISLNNSLVTINTALDLYIKTWNKNKEMKLLQEIITELKYLKKNIQKQLKQRQ